MRGKSNPSFATSSTTDLLVLNCGVKVVGDMPLTIKTTSGEVVYTTTVTVPKPRHWSRSVKLSGHDPWNTQMGAAIRSIPKTGWDAISKPVDTLLLASCFLLHASKNFNRVGNRAHKLAVRLCRAYTFERHFISLVSDCKTLP